MPEKGFTAITVRESTLKRLDKLKKEVKARSYDQAIEFLLDRVEAKENPDIKGYGREAKEVAAR